MTSSRHRRLRRLGAASTETILTVALVAVGCLAVVTVFGRQIAALFGRSTDAIGTGQVQAVQAERPADYSALNAAGGGSASGGGGGDPGAPGVTVPSGSGSGSGSAAGSPTGSGAGSGTATAGGGTAGAGTGTGTGSGTKDGRDAAPATPGSAAPGVPPAGVIGTTGYYRWRYDDYLRRHPNGPPPPDYYLDYGEKYALRFTHELRPLLSDNGRAWLDRARMNLQTAIENERRRDPEAFARLEEDPDAFRRFAYDTHADAYWRAGLADLPLMDLIRIGTTPDLRDLFTQAGLGQVADIAGRMVQEYYDRARAAGSDALDDPLGTAGVVWDSFREGVRDNAQGWWRGVRTLGELF